jgi:hypothetical protein
LEGPGFALPNFEADRPMPFETFLKPEPLISGCLSWALDS